MKLINEKTSVKYVLITAVLAVTTCLFAVLPIYFEIGSIMAFNIVLAAGLLICGIIRIDFLRFDVFRQYKLKMFIPFILFAVFLGIGMIYQGEIKDYIVSYLFQYIGPVVLFLFFLKDRKQLNTVIDVLIIFTGIMCLFGFIEFFTRFNVWSLVETVKQSGLEASSASFERNGYYRIEQAFEHCIPYSTYLLAVISLIWYRFVTNKRKVCRAVYAAVWFLACVNVFMTYSRFAMILLVLLNLVMLLKIKPKLAVILVVASICGVALLLLVGWIFNIEFIIHNSNVKTFLAIFDTKSTATEANTTLYRLILQSEIPKRIENRWILGCGPAWTKGPFNLYSAKLDFYQYVESIDNNYLFRIMEFGIVGLFGIITYYAGTVGAVITGLKAKGHPRFKDIDKRYPFVWYASVIMIFYFIIWLSVAQMSEFKVFNLIIGMLFAYYRLPEEAE